MSRQEFFISQSQVKEASEPFQGDFVAFSAQEEQESNNKKNTSLTPRSTSLVFDNNFLANQERGIYSLNSNSSCPIPISQGCLSTSVEVLKKILKKLGYFTEEYEHALFDVNTKNALEKFQSQHSLEITGTLTSETEEKIRLAIKALDLKKSLTRQDLAAKKNLFDRSDGSSQPELNVLSPRRQTEQMVLESQLFLPEQIKKDTLFVLTERLVQNPEKFIKELKNKKKVVLIGSFIGTGILKDWGDYNSYILPKILEESNSEHSQNNISIRESHDTELDRLKISLDIISRENPGVDLEIVYGMGDSVNFGVAEEASLGYQVRESLQLKLKEIVNQFNKERESSNKVKIPDLTWGADELVLQSMAKQLPEISAYVYISNPSAKNYWDSGSTTGKIVREKAEKLGINLVDDLKADSDIKIFIINRKPGLPRDRTRLAEQREYNKSQLDLIAKFLKNLSEEEREKVLIIDSVFPAGSSIELSDIKEILAEKHNLDLSKIHWSSWGTAGNNISHSLAEQKIRANFINNSQNAEFDTASEQLFAQQIQAFAHDFIFNNETIKPQLVEAFEGKDIQVDPLSPKFDYWPIDPLEIEKIHLVMEGLINQKLEELFGDSFSEKYYLKLTYQFSRNYEAVTQLIRKTKNEEVLKVPIIYNQKPELSKLRAFSPQKVAQEVRGKENLEKQTYQAPQNSPGFLRRALNWLLNFLRKLF